MTHCALHRVSSPLTKCNASKAVYNAAETRGSSYNLLQKCAFTAKLCPGSTKKGAQEE